MVLAIERRPMGVGAIRRNWVATAGLLRLLLLYGLSMTDYATRRGWPS